MFCFVLLDITLLNSQDFYSGIAVKPSKFTESFWRLFIAYFFSALLDGTVAKRRVVKCCQFSDLLPCRGKVLKLNSVNWSRWSLHWNSRPWGDFASFLHCTRDRLYSRTGPGFGGLDLACSNSGIYQSPAKQKLHICGCLEQSDGCWQWTALYGYVVTSHISFAFNALTLLVGHSGRAYGLSDLRND